jgi:hypothetical protein
MGQCALAVHWDSLTISWVSDSQAETPHSATKRPLTGRGDARVCVAAAAPSHTPRRCGCPRSAAEGAGVGGRFEGEQIGDSYRVRPWKMLLRRVSDEAWCLMAGASTCALVYTNRTRKRTHSSMTCGDCLVVSRLSPSSSARRRVPPVSLRGQCQRLASRVHVAQGLQHVWVWGVAGLGRVFQVYPAYRTVPVTVWMNQGAGEEI